MATIALNERGPRWSSCLRPNRATAAPLTGVPKAFKLKGNMRRAERRFGFYYPQRGALPSA